MASRAASLTESDSRVVESPGSESVSLLPDRPLRPSSSATPSGRPRVARAPLWSPTRVSLSVRTIGQSSTSRWARRTASGSSPPRSAHRRPALGLAPAPLRGRVVELLEAWPRAAALRRDLTTCRTPAQALDAVEATLATAEPFDPNAFARCEAAVRQLSTDPARSVTDIATALGVSHGHLDRQFTEQVGLSPRTLARILRMRRLLEAIDVPRIGGVGGQGCGAGVVRPGAPDPGLQAPHRGDAVAVSRRPTLDVRPYRGRHLGRLRARSEVKFVQSIGPRGAHRGGLTDRSGGAR